MDLIDGRVAASRPFVLVFAVLGLASYGLDVQAKNARPRRGPQLVVAGALRRPRSSRNVRSACAAMLGSCVTMMMV